MAPSAGILQNPRVALIHHWLVRMRGGEKVLESLCRLFPQADIYTLVFDPSAIPDSIKCHPITTSWIQKLPWAITYYSQYLPLFPIAIEQFDLSAYDLVLSSDAAVGKGDHSPRTLHLLLSHSSAYAWSAYPPICRPFDPSAASLLFSITSPGMWSRRASGLLR
jgi:hypothetical protein